MQMPLALLFEGVQNYSSVHPTFKPPRLAVPLRRPSYLDLFVTPTQSRRSESALVPKHILLNANVNRILTLVLTIAGIQPHPGIHPRNSVG